MRHPNPAATNPLQGTKLYEWGLLSRASLASLVVNDERRDWILETYPPEDMGRPGILVPLRRGEKLRKVDVGEELDPDEEQDELLDVEAD